MASDTYRDRQDSKIFGSRLIIFRRKGVESGYFSFRAKISGVAGYFRKSCGTSDAAQAMVFAEGAYEDLLVRHKGGFSLRELTVDKFFNDWLERKKHNFTASRAK